jgi:hypothetical protein
MLESGSSAVKKEGKGRKLEGKTKERGKQVKEEKLTKIQREEKNKKDRKKGAESKKIK